MASDSALPIPLHQVLEEEYVALHGSLPADYPHKETDPRKRREAIVSLIHKLKYKRTALCFSGGGIRSASFALGIMQGLAERGLLGKFDYLSTVSGGGYIGGWLTAWCKRAGGIEKVSGPLAASAKGTDDAAKKVTECAPLVHLRSHTQFLSPQIGIMSADTWTLASTYLRNLILNWLVFFPFIMAVLMIPRMVSALVTDFPNTKAEGIPWNWVLFAVGTTSGLFAMTYTCRRLPSGRRTLAQCIGGAQTGKAKRSADSTQAQAKFVMRGLLPILLSALFLIQYWAWQCNSQYTKNLDSLPPASLAQFVTVAVAIHIVAWVLFMVHYWRLKNVWIWAMVLAYGATGAVVGWGLWLVATEVFPRPFDVAPYYTCFAAPLVLGLFMLALTAFIGLVSGMTEDDDREWWARAMGWVLAAAAGWSLFSSIVVFGPAIFASAKGWVISIGGTSGLVCLLLGKSAASEASTGNKAISGLVSKFTQKLPALCVVLFIPFLLTLLTMASNWLLDNLPKFGWIKAILPTRVFDWLFTWRGVGAVENMNFPGLHSEVSKADTLYHLAMLYQPSYQLIFAVFIAFIAIGLLMSWFINSNTFSLHAIYRARITRAFLGASTVESRPDAFTGFDPQDDMPVSELGTQRPFHVVNLALNLVSGSNRAWQERKAASFTVSPLHSGSAAVDRGDAGAGYRPSSQYGGAKGITMGTAIAISGAAASPNMGYHSSPLVAFVLSLFNVRLGAWLGNPGATGSESFRHDCPKFTGAGILEEAFGMTTSTKPYVYLSDGGHFENLGLYEMVRRRCHFIIVSDGGADPNCAFEDLGNAIRKIRIDLGIPIEFGDSMGIHARIAGVKPSEGRYCAIGTIRYSATDDEGTDGVLIYIKPAFYGDEPRDVFEYATRSKSFPHETTADQFFNESQFESYRALGVYVAQKVFGSGGPQLEGIDQLVQMICSGHLKV
jgi:hypothetical protein